MQKIIISDEIAQKVTNIQLSCIECDVKVEDMNQFLWEEVIREIKNLNQQLKVEDISKLPAIAASRIAYKLCGKDPARYRLSAEALLRRVLKRKEIYQVNNVVDLLNLVSIKSGFSIGGYDADKINGVVKMGIGKTGEPYLGIGRGELNIEGMPVFRDESGAFGTSTSDSERTCVDINTTRFLMIIADYGAGYLNKATNEAIAFLKQYADGDNFENKKIK